MKQKTLAFIVVLAACAACYAQPKPHKEHKPHPDITKVVSDLSSSQKRKIEAITEQSRARMDNLRASQTAVRDSICMLMDREGDQSKALFPLFDREGRLQSELSREMYTTRLRIDEVLTPAQRAELKKASRQHQPKQRPPKGERKKKD